MKKLLLIRHAKATHQSGFVDFERPLTSTGLHDGAVMAGKIVKQGIVPQMLVASPSLRTLSTANLILQHAQISTIKEIPGIYDASLTELIDIIARFNDSFDFIGLVGHNPAVAQALYYLTDQTRDVPPGAVALIEFEIDTWAAVGNNNGILRYYDEP